MPPKKRGPKAGAKIKAVSKRDAWNANKTSRAAEGEWKVVRGVLRLVKKK